LYINMAILLAQRGALVKQGLSLRAIALIWRNVWTHRKYAAG
jgi:hypothetical protein